MDRYRRTQEGSQSDPSPEWTALGPETGLEEGVWRMGLGEGEFVYPERPDEADCIYYLRTGFCGYGNRCRFNHPRHRGAVLEAARAGVGEFPERIGQPICQYYMRTGTCKFGASCKYHHPKQGGDSVAPVLLNYLGYPLRPGEKKCAYYVKTGQCKFGATCKFHHPQRSNIQFPVQSMAPLIAPVPGPVPATALYPTVQSPSAPSSQQYGVVGAGPPLLPGSYRPYDHLLFAQASGSRFASHSAAGCSHLYYVGSSRTDQKEPSFPDRPGQPECRYYLRTGDCKFRSSCRYHHPPPKTNVVLSPIGLPLRPRAPVCTHYKQRGLCKFGPACKFDHPMRELFYTSMQMIAKSERLNEEEAWDLFMKTCGHILPPNVEVIARSFARECAGLPLAIVTMAGSMKGVDDVRVWKNAFVELQGSIIRQDDMGEGVFRILRYSYTRLNDHALQQCFLYCALFPKDERIMEEQLIAYLIVEGIIEHEMDTIQAKYDKGYAMLNKLENVFLLERLDYGRVRMHDLVRDMAIQIIKECQPSIIEPEEELEYVPDEKFWRKNIVKVSLMKNYIYEIPPNFSPSCPHLSTLLLSYNEQLLSIADSFFVHLQGLKVLDLSHTGIMALPKSIAGLTHLTALFLQCSEVRYIPILANLKSMELLDLSWCYGIKEVPQGLESLSNLRYLNLFGSGIKEFPTGILPKLTYLQFLAFDMPSKNGEELRGLEWLETLKWCFPIVGDLSTFLYWVPEMPRKQMKYNLLVALPEFLHDHLYYGNDEHHEVTLSHCTISGELREFQIDFLRLLGVSFGNGRGLCSHLPMGLKKLWIEECGGIEYLFNLSTSLTIFQNLEEFKVFKVDNLNVLFVDCGMTIPFCLKVLDIQFCSVKKLLAHGLLASLQNLEKIRVRHCEELEEIISVEENSQTFSLSLPNLRQLDLFDLPKLKRICREHIKCEHLQSILIDRCEELKNVSIGNQIARCDVC